MNETVFEEHDLAKDIGKTCNAGSEVVVNGSRVGATVPTDTRELLYGDLSVRGANWAALVFGGVAFLIACFSKSLDFDMESKYEGDDTRLTIYDPNAFAAGIFFHLFAASTVIAATLSSLLVLPALSVEASSMMGVDRNMTFDDSCEKLGFNHIQRFRALGAVLVTSVCSIVFVGVMVRAVKYDAKASKKSSL